MLCRALAAFALAILVAGPAAAAKSLFTLPAGGDVSHTVGCLVQNIDTKSRTVTATLRDQTGSSVDSATVDIAPGNVLTVASNVGLFAAYCEFQGLSSKVRGFINVNSGAATVLVLPAEK